jgi:hypothetical protein
MTGTVQADYLIVGAGAMGMAFADVLMTETEATVVMVDRHHQPGGHWNDAYPFVRLHQPSSFYGVNSRKLGSDTIDATGWNKGLYELATNSEVCAYFDQVMQQQFLPSGRLQYFPMCDYLGDGRFKSLTSPEEFSVEVAKTVDATYMHVTVPSMRPPVYQVDDGVACSPPNALPQVHGEFDHYTVIGAGKTGMDACLFLLRNGVDPGAMSWVMPRDSWLLDRANIQPGKLFAESIVMGFARQFEVFAAAGSVEDALTGVAAQGQLLRFDESVWPTMYRCATVTRSELEQLQRIENVIRLGRVQSIGSDEIQLDQGSVATSATTLHIDCTADGLEQRPVVPVFAGTTLTLQSVRTCQQVFSAAFIGHVEAAYDDDVAKNELCTPVPHPDSELDFLKTSLANGLNGARWSQDADLQQWLQNARLDGFSQIATETSESGSQRQEAERILSENALPAIINLQKLIAEAEAVAS